MATRRNKKRKRVLFGFIVVIIIVLLFSVIGVVVLYLGANQPPVNPIVPENATSTGDSDRSDIILFEDETDDTPEEVDTGADQGDALPTGQNGTTSTATGSIVVTGG